MDSGDSGILTETKFIDHSTFNNTDLTGANFKGTGNIHPGLTIGQDGKFISYKKEPSESESESVDNWSGDCCADQLTISAASSKF